MFWCREWVREAATQPSGKSAALYSRLSVGDEDKDSGEKPDTLEFAPFIAIFARKYSGIEYRKIVLSQRYSTD